jgi:general secretion pathway protein M
MMALRAWFSALSLREKRLVMTAAALMVVTLFWFGLARPVSDGLADARIRHSNAVLRLAEIAGQLESVKLMQRTRAAPIAAPLETVVRERAASAGFALANVSPQPNNGLQIAIAAARPGALIGWIADLEASGILVESLTTAENPDRTISATMVLKTQGL